MRAVFHPLASIVSVVLAPRAVNSEARPTRALLACALQDADTAREPLTLVQTPMIADPGWRAPGRPCAACWRLRPALWT